LLHLLGFDHEISDEAEQEMEEEEELLLKNLGWKGKGLIQSAYDIQKTTTVQPEKSDGIFPVYTKLQLCNDHLHSPYYLLVLAKINLQTTVIRQEGRGWPKIVQTKVFLYIL